MEKKSDEPLIVMITGSNRGIGIGLVSEYLKRGCMVIATCRFPDQANDLKKILAENYDSGSFICKLDIDSESSVVHAFNFVSTKVKTIDILINNAGVASKNHPHDPILEVDPEDMLKLYRINSVGPWRVTSTFLPLLRNRGAKILFVSSDLASIENNELHQSDGNYVSYRCAKAALNMLARNFAVEVPDVSFLAISPGWVATRMGSMGGRKPTLTISESAQRIATMAEALTKEDSGAFWTAKFKDREKWLTFF